MNGNKVYFIATLTTISIILLNQFFIQYWLYQKREDANVINIAGRQRMLSQRLVGLTYAHYNSPDKVSREQLEEVFFEWKGAHQLLLQKFVPRLLSLRTVAQTYKSLQNLAPYFDIGERYVVGLSSMDTHSFELFRENQDSFLTDMDRIVGRLEADSQAKLNLIVFIEILFALLSLFLIYYEIVYIFRAINRDLANKNAELIESNDMLEQYAYLAAHDLRAPTQNIVNFSGLLRKKLDSRMEPSEKEYFGFISNSAKRLLDTTDDLLKFSTISNEKLKVGNCEVEGILENVVKDLEVPIREKNASIQIGPMPPQIIADCHLLHLVFQNLVSNGIKFVHHGSSPLVQIRYEDRKKEHFFSIEDNGIGISPKDQEKIFGLFKRLHDQKSYRGTGIGLTICQKVIEKHKGEISLQSEVGKGTTFHFSISKNLI
ncbi:MAG: ATP-binding protein [Bacteroidota bacterium]